MSRSWTPNKKTVALEQRPSRIRRDPVRVDKAAEASKTAWWDQSERETWVVVLGVLTFALMISVLTIGISEITS